MIYSEYVKVYEGNFILVNRIKDELRNSGIIPIIKDESESQRLAGFGVMNQGFQEVFVNTGELEKATTIVAYVKSNMETNNF